METRRCRPRFEAALATSENKVEFYRGVIVAYCEKLVLGVCAACMLKPDDEYHDTVIKLLEEMEDYYPIDWFVVADDACPEIWFGMSGSLQQSIQMWIGLTRNSAAWHTQRGLAVGIPFAAIDERYHEKD